jgi:hypothetical protein
MAYRATYLELPQQVEYLYEAQFAQDRVWFVDHDYDEQTQKAAAFLASFKSDGTDYQRTALALPEEMNVQSFCIAGDGAITALSAQYDPQTYRPAYSLLRFSADGALLSDMALEDIFEGQDAYIQHMIADPEGNLALFAVVLPDAGWLVPGCRPRRGWFHCRGVLRQCRRTSAQKN